MKYFPAPMSRAESDAFVDRISEQLAASFRPVGCGEATDAGSFVGFVGLGRAAFQATSLRRSKWAGELRQVRVDHGYATEAASDRRGLRLSEGLPWTRSVFDQCRQPREPGGDADRHGPTIPPTTSNIRICPRVTGCGGTCRGGCGPTATSATPGSSIANEPTSRGVLVTGASRGVGAATAAAFASRGNRVVGSITAVPSTRRIQSGRRCQVRSTPSWEVTVRPRTGGRDRRCRDRRARSGRRAGQQRAMFAEPRSRGQQAERDTACSDVGYDELGARCGADHADNLLGPGTSAISVARHMIDTAAGRDAAAGEGSSTSAHAAHTRRARRARVRLKQGRPARAGPVAGGRARPRTASAWQHLAPGFIATDMAAERLEAPAARRSARRARSAGSRLARRRSRARRRAGRPGAEWASGAVVDFNGASYLR